MGEAVGIVELYGLVAAFAAADAGCKAANVVLENFDKNKPANADALPVPLIVAVKFRGSVSDVKAAVEGRTLVGKVDFRKLQQENNERRLKEQYEKEEKKV